MLMLLMPIDDDADADSADANAVTPEETSGVTQCVIHMSET